MTRLYLALAMILFPILSMAAGDSGDAAGMLLVANKGDRSLGFVDPAAAKQLTTVPEGGVTGHEVIASPDGKTAYVPIYGDSGVGKPGSNGRNLVVIDVGTRKATGTSISATKSGRTARCSDRRTDCFT